MAKGILEPNLASDVLAAMVQEYRNSPSITDDRLRIVLRERFNAKSAILCDYLDGLTPFQFGLLAQKATKKSTESKPCL